MCLHTALLLTLTLEGLTGSTQDVLKALAPKAALPLSQDVLSVPMAVLPGALAKPRVLSIVAHARGLEIAAKEGSFTGSRSTSRRGKLEKDEVEQFGQRMPQPRVAGLPEASPGAKYQIRAELRRLREEESAKASAEQAQILAEQTESREPPVDVRLAAIRRHGGLLLTARAYTAKGAITDAAATEFRLRVGAFSFGQEALDRASERQIVRIDDDLRRFIVAARGKASDADKAVIRELARTGFDPVASLAGSIAQSVSELYPGRAVVVVGDDLWLRGIGVQTVTEPITLRRLLNILHETGYLEIVSATDHVVLRPMLTLSAEARSADRTKLRSHLSGLLSGSRSDWSDSLSVMRRGVTTEEQTALAFWRAALRASGYPSANPLPSPRIAALFNAQSLQALQSGLALNLLDPRLPSFQAVLTGWLETWPLESGRIDSRFQHRFSAVPAADVADRISLRLSSAEVRYGRQVADSAQNEPWLLWPTFVKSVATDQAGNTNDSPRFEISDATVLELHVRLEGSGTMQVPISTRMGTPRTEVGNKRLTSASQGHQDARRQPRGAPDA
jgi:hypothetical protein